MSSHGPTEPSQHQIVHLKSHRMSWTALGIVVLPIGAFFALAAPVSLAATMSWPERLGLSALCVAVAIPSCLFGLRALRLGRARPCLVVKPDALVIHHPGLLREAVSIPKTEVETVCVGDFVKRRRPPPGSEGNGPFRRLRTYSRWLDSGGQFPQFSASTVLPDLSFPFYFGPFSNVLIILRRPFDLGRTPRRGLAVLTGEDVYRGPTRGARIRGLLAAARDIDEARRAFSPWRMTQEAPTEEMIAWVSPARPRT